MPSTLIPGETPQTEQPLQPGVTQPQPTIMPSANPGSNPPMPKPDVFTPPPE